MTTRSLADRYTDLWQSLLYRAMRWMPTEWASAVGGFVARVNVRTSKRSVAHAARQNLRRHFPEATDREIEAMVSTFIDNIGRTMAEFALLDRFVAEGRIEVQGGQAIIARQNTAPTILLAVHTGNWEVFLPAAHAEGVKVANISVLPESPFQAYVADQARRKFGFKPLRLGMQGVRDAMAELRNNGIVSFFGDEARAGRLMAPLFGRPPHDEGNLAMIARIARKTGAAISIAHCRRVAPCHFVLHVDPPFHLPDSANADVLDDVVYLNSLIEPIIRANLPRWYFLDDRID